MSGSTAQLLNQSHRIAVQFLLADLDMALTFLDVSEVTALEASSQRNLKNARHVYDTVVRLLPRVSPSSEEHAFLEHKLAELHRRLIARRQLLDPQREAIPGS